MGARVCVCVCVFSGISLQNFVPFGVCVHILARVGVCSLSWTSGPRVCVSLGPETWNLHSLIHIQAFTGGCNSETLAAASFWNHKDKRHCRGFSILFVLLLPLFTVWQYKKKKKLWVTGLDWVTFETIVLKTTVIIVIFPVCEIKWLSCRVR